jgi:hypothetical protein
MEPIKFEADPPAEGISLPMTAPDMLRETFTTEVEDFGLEAVLLPAGSCMNINLKKIKRMLMAKLPDAEHASRSIITKSIVKCLKL